MEDDYDDEQQKLTDFVLGLCSALGGFEESIDDSGKIRQVYSVGDEALACLKDLKRAIRLDSQNNQKLVLSTLSEFNVVETDIVPMILSFKEDRNEITNRFVLACVEILVPMTWPMDKNLGDRNNDEEEEEEELDPNMMDCYRRYKSSLLAPGVFEIILDIIVGPLSIPYRERSVRDQTIIRLVLYFFRNISAIPDLIASQAATVEQIRLSHLQETFVTRLYQSDILELLLTIASNTSNDSDSGEWNVIVLEIIYNIVKHVSPKDVFFYEEVNNNVGDGNETTSVLGALLQKETANKRMKTSAIPTRHNRFGGTYVLKDWDGNSRITHKQEGGFADVTGLIDGDKKADRRGKKRKLRNELYIQKVYQDSRSLKYIKSMSQSFLQSCFNAFYTSLLKDMKREDKKIMKNDITRYYHTMKWYLEYIGFEQRDFQLKKREEKEASKINNNTTKNINTTLIMPEDIGKQPQQEEEEEEKERQPYDFDMIAGVMDLSTILYCLQMIRARLDAKEWFGLQVTADCLKQMLISLTAMGRSEEAEYREVAEYIQSNLYYEQFTFDLLVDLIRCYRNQSYEYLKIVVLLIHHLLKLLEQYLETKKVIFVRKRKAIKERKEERPEGEDYNEEDDEEEYQNKIDYKEHEFNFNSFEDKFISSKVVDTYCVLLESYRDLQSEHIHCITSMFHRIMVKRRVEYLFWKLPVMALFNRILLDQRNLPNSTAFRQLREFIIYSTRQFFSGAESYPLLFVEALFPTAKTNRSIWEKPISEQESGDTEFYNPVSDDDNNNKSSSDDDDDGDDEEGSSSNRRNKKNKDKGKEKEKEATNSNDIDPDMLDTYFAAFDDLDKEKDNEPLFTTASSSTS